MVNILIYSSISAFICVPSNGGKPASPTDFRLQLRSDFLSPLLIPGFHLFRLSVTFFGKILSPSLFFQVWEHYTEYLWGLSRGILDFAMEKFHYLISISRYTFHIPRLPQTEFQQCKNTTSEYSIVSAPDLLPGNRPFWITE